LDFTRGHAKLTKGRHKIAGKRREAPVATPIGALPTVSTQIMPRAMKLFLAEGAGATIKIVTGENAVLLEQ
jgi:LysR family pca operon transcriptional activator